MVIIPPPPPPPPVSPATGFNAVPPCRLLDTRNAVGPLGAPALGALASRSFVAAGNCSIPSGTVAISANVTVVSPTVAGDLVAYPNGLASPPGTSTIAFRAGRTRANNALIYLAGDGSFLVTNRAAVTWQTGMPGLPARSEYALRRQGRARRTWLPASLRHIWILCLW